MRFIIVVDGQSIIDPTTLWHKFDRRRRERPDEGITFQILPISKDVLDISRGNSETLKKQAQREADRVIRRYQDVKCCVVVYAELQPPSWHKRPTYFDHAIIQFRDQAPKEIVLNERVGVTKRGT